MNIPLSQLDSLASATARLSAAHDLNALAKTLHDFIADFAPVEYSAMYFLVPAPDPRAGEMRLYYSLGFTDEERHAAASTAWVRHPGWVVRNNQMLHIPDVDRDTEARSVTDPVRKWRVRSRLFLPIRADGEAIGTFGLASVTPDYFTETHIKTSQLVCNIAGVMYKNIVNTDRLNAQLDLIKKQQRDLLTLATPILDLGARCIAIPVIGSLDAERATHMAEKVLAELAARKARAVILDLSGLDSLDEGSAARLLRICEAVALLGGRCVLSGLSTRLAQLLSERVCSEAEASQLERIATFATVEQAVAAVAVAPGRRVAAEPPRRR